MNFVSLVVILRNWVCDNWVYQFRDVGTKCDAIHQIWNKKPTAPPPPKLTPSFALASILPGSRSLRKQRKIIDFRYFLKIWGEWRLIAVAIYNSGKTKAPKHTSFWPVTPPVRGGVSLPGCQESKIYVLSLEPKEHESFAQLPDWEDRGDRTGFYVLNFYAPLCSLITVEGLLKRHPEIGDRPPKVSIEPSKKLYRAPKEVRFNPKRFYRTPSWSP